MSDKDVFLAHVARLVAWLRTCGLDRVDARSDVRVEDYSRDFVVWLIARFPVGNSPLSNRPDAWIRSLEAARGGLHERKLPLVKMADDSAEAPFVHWAYRDVHGVPYIEFVCAKAGAARTAGPPCGLCISLIKPHETHRVCFVIDLFRNRQTLASSRPA